MFVVEGGVCLVPRCILREMEGGGIVVNFRMYKSYVCAA